VVEGVYQGANVRIGSDSDVLNAYPKGLLLGVKRTKSGPKETLVV